MKSSTLRRANLSKEKMQVLETLAKYRRQVIDTNNQAQYAYKKPVKDKELDMLWNSFKQHNKQDKSPTVYLITGFVAGILVTVIVTILIQMSMTSMNETAKDITTKVPETKIEDTAITFIPADKETVSVGAVTTATSSNEKYTVQSGDTLEKIIIRFYGSYRSDYVQAIKDANGLRNPNALSIGQQLIIPLH